MEAVLTNQKDLKKIVGWKEVPSFSPINDLLIGYEVFEQKPMFQPLSQAIALHMAKHFQRGTPKHVQYRTVPISGRRLNKFHNLASRHGSIYRRAESGVNYLPNTRLRFRK
jgi:hypothetical protein